MKKKYKLTFVRQWVEHDEFERVIEADSEDDASVRAVGIANAADQDCPDDATSYKDGSAGDWVCIEIEEAPADAEVDEPEVCPECGAVEGTEEWGTVGDGFDGYCPSCADKREAAGVYE
jgi:hypothetical protein